MQNAVFNISERTEKGKKVRMEGSIPAIMYGQSLGEPIPCQRTKRELIDLHLDFQYVKKGDTIKLRVPIRFSGTESLDARKLLLDDVITEVQLQGNPSEMPEHIEVDVAGLEHGAQILAKDLVIPETLKSDLEPDTVVARIGSLKTSSIEVEDDNNDEETAE